MEDNNNEEKQIEIKLADNTTEAEKDVVLSNETEVKTPKKRKGGIGILIFILILAALCACGYMFKDQILARAGKVLPLENLKPENKFMSLLVDLVSDNNKISYKIKDIDGKMYDLQEYNTSMMKDIFSKFNFEIEKVYDKDSLNTNINIVADNETLLEIYAKLDKKAVYFGEKVLTKKPFVFKLNTMPINFDVPNKEKYSEILKQTSEDFEILKEFINVETKIENNNYELKISKASGKFREKAQKIQKDEEKVKKMAELVYKYRNFFDMQDATKDDIIKDIKRELREDEIFEEDYEKTNFNFSIKMAVENNKVKTINYLAEMKRENENLKFEIEGTVLKNNLKEVTNKVNEKEAIEVQNTMDDAIQENINTEDLMKKIQNNRIIQQLVGALALNAN